MNLQEIERLIGKYEAGETTVEEELELKIFFAKENVPVHLAGYKDLFSFYRKAVEEELEDPGFDEKVLGLISGGERSPSKKTRYRRLYPIIGMAATVIVLFGLYVLLSINARPADTFSDPDAAYAETRKILLKVSDNLNEGMTELSNVEAINTGMDDLSKIKSFDEGMKKMQKISVLDKSKDIITQKTNKR